MMINCRHILHNFKYINRYYSSALYITGHKAQKTFAVLTPVIDFEKQLIKKDELLKNIAVRGLTINFEDITKQWAFFQEVLQRKQMLELTRQDIAQSVSKLLKDSNCDPAEIDKLKLHAKIIKDDLKNLTNSYYDIEEATMLKILALPNVLHNKTPVQVENVVYTHLEKPLNESLSNMEIGVNNKYIKYLDPLAYYLQSDAALLELSATNYLRKKLLKFGYLQFSNPNFCRTIISEGCEEYGDQKIFSIEEQDHDEDNLNRLHLCGSGSLYSFMAYFARHAVHQTAFPLRYFSLGKIYQPVKYVETPSLFNLSQHTVVNIFSADLEENGENLENLITEISNIYNKFGFHYRITILPSNKIEKSESLRISIQMYSNFEKKYVEVGNVSFYASYVSKRLLFTYRDKEKKYPHVVAGPVLNFHKFLGCALENISGDDHSLLTVKLKKLIVELNNVE